MTRFILIMVLSLAIFSCKNDTAKQQELTLEAKELLLKEKELELRAKEFPNAEVDTAQFTVDQQTDDQEAESPSTNTEEKQGNRKLRFLYYSSIGLRAYFNDGSVFVFPKRGLTKENIQFIKSNSEEKAIQTYVIEKDGSLLIDGWKHEYPVVNKNENFEGWAMINYKWLVKF
ncbi:hypothetical protein [Flavobacterium hiemivividum]|uniref:Lipoprotein n=1 Tax=Flavobacterium hiemivividum TaxID=2541734 RepID=A0A4R5D112_9FLAO|nr:hypothetical protein [Flavobacterium hiemivividum]TDE06746.1 hypothetical protein E0F98_03780 [Flavobacterium hiemivividum]